MHTTSTHDQEAKSIVLREIKLSRRRVVPSVIGFYILLNCAVVVAVFTFGSSLLRALPEGEEMALLVAMTMPFAITLFPLVLYSLFLRYPFCRVLERVLDVTRCPEAAPHALGEIKGFRRRIVPAIIGLVFVLCGAAIAVAMTFRPFLVKDAAGVPVSASGLTKVEASALLVVMIVPLSMTLCAMVFGTLYLRYLFCRVLVGVLEATRHSEAASYDPDPSAPQSGDPPA